MQYVTLGRSSLKVSRLALGAMGFGSPGWRSWVLAEEQSRAVARKALDSGINLIDTCDYYSNGRSEEIVGSIEVVFEKNELVLRHRTIPPDPLKPVRPDTFTVEGMTLGFTRDSKGEVDGFTLDMGRVKGIAYTKER